MAIIGTSKGIVSANKSPGGRPYVVVHDDTKRCNKWEIVAWSTDPGETELRSFDKVTFDLDQIGDDYRALNVKICNK